PGEVLDLRRDLEDAFEICAANDGRDQTFVNGYCYADISLAVEANVLFLIRGVNERMLHQYHRCRLNDDVVDTDLLFLGNGRVDTFSQLKRVVHLDLDGQIERRDRADGFGKTRCNDTPHLRRRLIAVSRGTDDGRRYKSLLGWF